MRGNKLMIDDGNPDSGAGSAPAWYAPAEALKTSDPDVWEWFESGVKSGAQKDFPTLVKNHLNLERKLGSAINLPGKDAKPEEITALKSKLYQAGVFQAPPESADKYELALDAIPEAMRSTEVIKGVTGWAHKHGVSNDALKELIGIEAARYEGVVKPALDLDAKASMDDFGKWAAEQGKDTKELQAYGGAWLVKNLSEQEMQALDRSGLSNHPALLKLVAKAGLDTGEDISIAGKSASPDSPELKEAMDIIGNRENPQHKAYLQGDKDVISKINSAYAKAYGTAGANHNEDITQTAPFYSR